MQLPPAQVTRAVIQRYARVIARYSGDLGSRPLVLPNGEYFPDEFRGDQESVVQLAARMQQHAGLEDVPIRCTVVHPGTPEASGSSCKSGACVAPQVSAGGVARVIDDGESWLLQVPSTELRHPVALTTNLARSLAFVFLVETQREGELFEPPMDVTADLVAVALGFGALMLQGSYIYAKSCGGPQVGSVTKVGVSELSIAVALFLETNDLKLAPALKCLDVTQKAALSEASRLIRGNRRLIERLNKDPLGVARGHFELAEPSVMSNVFRKLSRKPRPASLGDLSGNMDLDELESLLMDMPPSSSAGRRLPRPSDPSKDDLKNLVAQEFGP